MGFFSRLNIFGGKKIKVTRRKDGTWSYFEDKDSFGDYSGHYLHLSLKNIALFTALDIRSSIFSRGKLVLKDKEGNIIEKDPILDLFKNPNFVQSQQDYFYSHLWFKSLGNNIARVIPKSLNANVKDINRVAGIENLIPSCIEYNKINTVDSFLISPSQQRELGKRNIIYKLHDKEHKLKVEELAFFYDITNNMYEDCYLTSPSRIKALLPDLLNVEEAQSAMNVNLKHSKKWLISNKYSDANGAMAMRPEEKEEVENRFHEKDIIASNANISTESMMVDFRKLMYDDILASAATRINSAYGISRDVLNWWMNGQTTYDNKKYAVVDWIQNSIQFEADDWGSTWIDFFGYDKEGKTLTLDYSHLPIMNLLEVKRMEAIKMKSEIVDTLVKAGVPIDKALELSEIETI